MSNMAMAATAIVVNQQEEIARIRAEVERLTEELEIERRRADAATNRKQAWEDEVERLRADARLGAMVRRMPEGSELIRCRMPSIAASDFSKWAIEVWGNVDDEDDRNYSGNTPEEALEKAGLKK